MSHTVTLYCKPYIARWLHQHYGNPVRFARKSQEQLVFRTMLQKQFYPGTYYKQEHYTAMVHIQISEHDVTQYGHTIKPELHHYLNRWFEKQFNLQLFMFVYAAYVAGHTIAHGIDSYMHLMQLNEQHISREAIEKKYTRTRHEISKNIFSKTVLPCTKAA